jgi:hypothetical protein
LLIAFLPVAESAHADPPDRTPSGRSPWRLDYGDGFREARRGGKMMLIYFYEPGSRAVQRQLEANLLADKSNRAAAERYVLVKLAVDTKLKIDGKKATLLEHEAFSEMRNRPGLAIIDLTDPHSEHYRSVVSVYPFGPGESISRKELGVLLDLPTGSLTQRTLIFAVRTHPERPASATGAFSPLLAEETEKHSFHQASLHSQGHHNWEYRFQRINENLPGPMVAREVCAESWPGQGLLEAAVECVRSWRQSPGHWSAVRARHPLFGYDMKRGRNRVWYATGIFARRR